MVRRTSIIVLAAFLAALAVAGPAGATTSTAETIVLQRDSAGTPIGWSASGTFTDSGSWTDPFGVGAGCIAQTPVCNIELKTVETGSAGTFQMEFQVHLNVVTNPTFFGGTWMISQGTGAYATLAGTGTWSRAVDPNTGVRTYTCLGLVHFN